MTYLLLVLLSLFPFYKFFIKGLIPFPQDILAGMYYPWLSKNYGLTTGVPVKNHIISDTVSQFWPWRSWAVKNLFDGQLSFWNPHSFMGYTQSPWFHTILFNPLNIFYFIFQKEYIAVSAIIISQIIIAVFSTYLLVFLLTKSKLVSIFSAISFSFSTFFIGWLMWGTVSTTLAFLPLIIYYLIKIETSKSHLNYLCLSLSIMFSFLGGHPQTFLYSFFVVLLYLLFNFKKHNFITYIVILLSFLQLSFVILPSLEVVQNSIRSLDDHIKSVNYGFINPIKLLITSFIPNFFGNSATLNYWGGEYNFQEKLIYFGTIPLFFALNSLFTKTKKTENIFKIIFVLSILFSIKNPISLLIYKINIPLLSSSSASRILSIFAFSGSILSAFSLKRYLDGYKINKKTILFLIIFSISIIISLFISYLYIYKLIDIELIPYLTTFIQNLKVASRNSIPFLSTSLFLLISIKFKKFLNSKMLIIIYILITYFDSYLFFKKYTPFVPNVLFDHSTPITDYLDNLSSKQFYRLAIEKAELMPPNTWQSYNLYTTGGYDPMAPKKYFDYLNDQNIYNGFSRYLEWSPDQFDKLSSLQIKYFLTIKRDPLGHSDECGNIHHTILNNPNYKIIFENGPMAILENQNDPKPFYLLYENSQNKLDLLSKTDNLWSFKSSSPIDNQLILLESNDSNWKAYVNDQKADIIDFQRNFKSVNLKSGDNLITFIYSNNLFKIGLIISLISLLSLFCLLFFFI